MNVVKRMLDKPYKVKYRTKRGITRWVKVRAYSAEEAEDKVIDKYNAAIIINTIDGIYKEY